MFVLSWLEHGANNVKLIGTISVWTIHLGAGLDDHSGSLSTQAILWLYQNHSKIQNTSVSLHRKTVKLSLIVRKLRRQQRAISKKQNQGTQKRVGKNRFTQAKSIHNVKLNWKVVKSDKQKLVLSHCHGGLIEESITFYQNDLEKRAHFSHTNPF